jgi:hypothetical protein
VGMHNFASTIGAYLLGLSVLLFAVNLVRSVRYGEPAGADPWGGGTLEWSIPSPPPPYNFATVPTVYSRNPLWDEKETGPATHEQASDTMEMTIAGKEVGKADVADDAAPHTADEHHIHMPNPSWYPVVVALGIFGVFGGLLVSPVVSVCGLALMFFGIYGWCLEPAG